MDWCLEEYTVTFPKESRRSFPPEDPLWKASQMLSCFGGTLSEYPKGYPLESVMLEMNLIPSNKDSVKDAVVKDIWVGGDSLSFKVENNFSKFDICRELSACLNVDLDVQARFRSKEIPWMEEIESELISHKIFGTDTLDRLIRDMILSNQRAAGREGREVFLYRDDLIEYTEGQYLRLHSVGPENDRLKLRDDVDGRILDCRLDDGVLDYHMKDDIFSRLSKNFSALMLSRRDRISVAGEDMKEGQEPKTSKGKARKIYERLAAAFSGKKDGLHL